MVPALALLGPWLALALIAAFRDGGSSDTGLTIAAVGAILACALALLLAAIGRLELPRPTGAGLVALAGLGLWCAVALASISWSLSPADSWQDGIHVACAAAALAGGMWIGALLRRPAQAACLVLAAIAVTVAVYAIAQRSFSSEFIAASFPRLREPFGYSNALAALFVSGVPATLVLGSRRSVVARAGGAACVAVLTVALILTGSRGGLLAALLAIVVLLVLGGRRLELVTTLACGVVPAAPVALYGVRLPTFSSANPPPSAGAGLLIGLIAAACIAAVAGALAQRIVDGLAAQTRVRTLRALGAAAAAIVLAGLVLAAVRTGGPIALVDRAWNQLTGNGQVSNATGNRFFTLSSNLRYRWWSEAWHAFTLRPIEGFGAGTFNLIDQLSRPDTTVAREAHSSGLQVLSGLGILGGIPALAALAGSAVACFEGWRRLAGEERVAAAALCGAVAGLAFHAQLDWDWTFAAITLVGYPIPGILSTAGRGTTRARSLERWMAGAALPLLAVLAIACALPLLSQRATTRADSLLAAGRQPPGARRERPRDQPRPAVDRRAARPRHDPAAARASRGCCGRRAASAEARAGERRHLAAGGCPAARLLARPQGSVYERTYRARALAVHALSTIATVAQYCTAKASKG